MQVQLESTSTILDLIIDGVCVPARLWQGHTATGIPCHAYITRIAVANDLGPKGHAEFDRDLQEHAAPRPEFASLPLRLIL